MTYDWRATPETIGHHQTLARITRSVTALGLGIDLACARASLHAQSPPPSPGIRYAPAQAARRHPRVPWSGAFDALEAACRDNRARIGAATVAGARDAPSRSVAYGSALDPPPCSAAAFALRTAADRPLGLEGTRAFEAAAMVRHAIGRAARAARLDPTVISELMGHGGENRIRVSPLPTVGHHHADGWIRRVMLTAPLGVPGDAWPDVVARLAGAPLVREHTRAATGVPAPLESGDAVLRRFRADARRWTTATPVVMPGCSATPASPRRLSSRRRSIPRRASQAAPPRTATGARATSRTTLFNTSR